MQNILVIIIGIIFLVLVIVFFVQQLDASQAGSLVGNMTDIFKKAQGQT